MPFQSQPTNGKPVGTFYPNDVWVQLEATLDQFPRETKMAHILTGTIIAGLANPNHKQIVEEYITKRAPNAKLAKAARAFQQLTPEERAYILAMKMDDTTEENE